MGGADCMFSSVEFLQKSAALVTASIAFFKEEKWGLLRWAQQHGDLVLVCDSNCTRWLHPGLTINLHWQSPGRPDSDTGALSQSPSRTLQSCVDLSHLYGPLQTHHLQQLIAEVLTTKLEHFGISDGAGRHPVRNLLTHSIVVPPLLCLTPEVRAAVHAGNVEDCDALQRCVAEVQYDPITLNFYALIQFFACG